MSLRDLSGRLADQALRERVQFVIHDRLADDLDQDECRYIMRLWWQLSMRYTEVTLEQLREHVHEPKLTAIEELIAAIRSAPADVEAWIDTAENDFPIIFDHGVYASLGLDDRRDDQHPGLEGASGG
ncbi:hypothetical protein KDL01_19955 [Actinospica durhamensis]|uniref:Uncharacterized protein n=1 Tax=Actinospica durhamensis TaxID=1508375 RepID=A0A941EQL1_9ACTN|nr:hypothetical protein [Actinospica durhamensis]MBR7835561.1 hypothetical protein [Actinospica durhamensis]